VVITGSSQGTGQSIAERLARDGAKIIIDYHSHAEGAQRTRELVDAAGSKGCIVKPTFRQWAGLSCS
jgi:NAD(P)-dependent dehydrogenase (short-subunit alcohol dehydrogenase family)